MSAFLGISDSIDSIGQVRDMVDLFGPADETVKQGLIKELEGALLLTVYGYMPHCARDSAESHSLPTVKFHLEGTKSVVMCDLASAVQYFEGRPGACEDDQSLKIPYPALKDKIAYASEAEIHDMLQGEDGRPVLKLHHAVLEKGQCLFVPPGMISFEVAVGSQPHYYLKWSFLPKKTSCIDARNYMAVCKILFGANPPVGESQIILSMLRAWSNIPAENAQCDAALSKVEQKVAEGTVHEQVQVDAEKTVDADQNGDIATASQQVGAEQKVNADQMVEQKVGDNGAKGGKDDDGKGGPDGGPGGGPDGGPDGGPGGGPGGPDGGPNVEGPGVTSVWKLLEA